MVNVIIPSEEYSNLDDAGKVALATAGIGGAVALATKPKRQLTAIEQVCGKQPKIGRKKKEAWQQCANNFNKPKEVPTPAREDTNKKDNKMLYIIGGSILGLGIIAFTIYKLKNK